MSGPPRVSTPPGPPMPLPPSPHDREPAFSPARRRGATTARQSFLLALLALGGGLVWWLSRGENGADVNAGVARPAVTTDADAAPTEALERDLSPAERARIDNWNKVGTREPGKLEIHGRVTSKDGSAIVRPDPGTRSEEELAVLAAKPTISVIARREAGGPPERAHVDKDGNYVVGGLLAGKWLVIARAIGHTGAEQTIELDGKTAITTADFALVPAAPVVVELVVHGAESGVPARDDAFRTRLLAETRVLLARATPSSPTMPFFVDGRMLMDERPFHASEKRGADWVLRERFEFHADLPKFASLLVAKHITDTVLVAEPGQPTVFELDAGPFAQRFATVSARIVDAPTGAPLTGAEFFLRQQEQGDLDAEDAALELQLQRGSADDTGRVTLPFLAPGTYDVFVHAAEHERQQLRVELAAGETRDLGTLLLDAPLTLRGQVTGADPATPLVVEALAQGSAVKTGTAEMVRANVALDGTFELRGVVRGKYLVRLMQPCELAAAPVEIEAGSGATVTLAAQRGSRVTFELHTEQVGGIEIDLFDERGACVVSSMRTGGVGRTFVLLPGKYRAAARRGNVQLTEQSFEVSGPTATVAVTIP